MNDLPFDLIMIDRGNGSQTTSVDELLSLPMAQRIQLIVQRKVHFFREGAPVDRALALKSLIVPLNPGLAPGALSQPST